MSTIFIAFGICLTLDLVYMIVANGLGHRTGEPVEALRGWRAVAHGPGSRAVRYLIASTELLMLRQPKLTRAKAIRYALWDPTVHRMLAEEGLSDRQAVRALRPWYDATVS